MLHFALLVEYIYQKLGLIIGVMLSQRLDIETGRKLQRETRGLRNIVTPTHTLTLYNEHIERERKGEEVDVQVQKRVPEHREWVEAVFDVVLFLIVNGLPFRDFKSDSAQGGLFINTFTDLPFKRNPRLKKISEAPR